MDPWHSWWCCLALDRLSITLTLIDETKEEEAGEVGATLSSRHHRTRVDGLFGQEVKVVVREEHRGDRESQRLRVACLLELFAPVASDPTSPSSSLVFNL